MTRSGVEAVRDLWERFEARDFDAAGEALAEDVVIDWPATRERIPSRRHVVELNRSYPEPWGHISVLDLIGAGERVAARIRIAADEATFFALGFYDVRDGLIRRGVEYWVTEGGETPPSERSRWTEPLPPER